MTEPAPAPEKKLTPDQIYAAIVTTRANVVTTPPGDLAALAQLAEQEAALWRDLATEAATRSGLPAWAKEAAVHTANAIRGLADRLHDAATTPNAR